MLPSEEQGTTRKQKSMAGMVGPSSVRRNLFEMGGPGEGPLVFGFPWEIMVKICQSQLECVKNHG